MKNVPAELFGSSGYRALVDKSFLHLAFELGLATGHTAHAALVGSDTRTTSEAVRHSIVSGLLASGCSAYDAGIVPTPTLAYCCRDFDIGVMITASHNPPQYNGIKLWNSDGSAIDAQQRGQIEASLGGHDLCTAPWQDMKGLISYPGAVKNHIDRILKDFPEKLGAKVVVDCGCGAGSVITPYLLEQLGCKVISLNSFPSGFFPRGIEPVAENLTEMASIVKALGADVGLAHDADADRLAVIDDQGRYVPGDKLLILLAGELRPRHVVTTVDASLAVEEHEYGVTRVRVGDAFVSEELKRSGDFGGEPCGAWIFPGISYCPDGIYAAAQVARMASRGKLSAMVDQIPSYPIRRGSVSGDRSLMPAVEASLSMLVPGTVSRVDGIRLAAADGWILVRPSGTEPKIRITAEGKNVQAAELLYNHAFEAVEKAQERQD